MNKSRRAGSIYVTSSNRKSQAPLKLTQKSHYNQNLPVSQQYQQDSNVKNQRHFDNQSLQTKAYTRKARRNSSSGQIVRKILAQTNNFYYADRERKSQQKYQYICQNQCASVNDRNYERTMQRLKQYNPRNRQYDQDYSSKGILMNQNCNRKKNVLALTNILNYNFNGQMMSKTAQVTNNQSYNAKNSELGSNKFHKISLREQKKEQYEFQRHNFIDFQRQDDRPIIQKDKLVNHKNQRQLRTTEYRPYHCQDIKDQKIKNFEYRFKTILSSYQQRKRQLSQEFNKMQTKSPIRAKSISAKINQACPKLDFQNLKSQPQNLSKKIIQNQQTKPLSKLSATNSPYQKSFISKAAKIPIDNLINSVRERNQNAQSRFNKIEMIEKDIYAKLNKMDRQKMNAKSYKDHEDFKQFFKALDQHISYEQKLRNLKHEIDNHSKVKEVIQDLALKGIARQELKLSSEQYDPFQSSATENHKQQRQISTIVEQYCSYRAKCEENWKAKFINMWNQQVIKRLFEKLDYSKKTQLSLKEFVRQFNCLTNRTLKIRELYKISERLKPMTRTNFVKRLSKIEI